MNRLTYHCHITPENRYISLTEIQHKVLMACEAYDHQDTTNTDINTLTKVGLKSADIGHIMARLRAVNLINYQHIETGRQAAGSGRYFLTTLNDYFGEVLPGEEERLP